MSRARVYFARPRHKKRFVMGKKVLCKFTLIEILAVIAIIAILAAIGFGSYSYANSAARESATQTILKQLEVALESFKTELGYYPSTKGDWHEIEIKKDSDGKLLISLSGNAPNKQDRLSKIVARTADTEMLYRYTNSDDKLCDAWGGVIYYRSKGKINKTSFDLVAPGNDGKFGKSNKAAPTNSWDISEFKTGGDAICDDIMNF